MSAPLPWRPVAPLGEREFGALVRRAICDCCKWDPQLEDAPALAATPIVLERARWDELSTLAAALARETLAAERELAARPALQQGLALPRAVRRALGSGPPAAGAARLIRFDFHWTRDGWRLSEANSDVPGGINEASGLAPLLAASYPGATSAGDVAAAYADALAATGARSVALVHATAYSDDHQVMVYLARRLAERGVEPLLVSPAQLRWEGGRARLLSAGPARFVDAIARFFPAEWLPNLPRAAGWRHYFADARTPASNPGAALLTQSKRFPLVWDALETPLPTWRALLPETRDPREVRWRDDDRWVLKPALGRVGDGIGIRGVTPEREWRRIARAARWLPGHWVAQRRFDAEPMRSGDAMLHPCIGVYTVDDRVAGAYGRLSARALTDWRSRDAAVLVAGASDAAAPRLIARA